jgi:hypothetical protein
MPLWKIYRPEKPYTDDDKTAIAKPPLLVRRRAMQGRKNAGCPSDGLHRVERGQY